MSRLHLMLAEKAKAPYRPSFHAAIGPNARVREIRRRFWLTRIAAPLILGGAIVYALLRLAGVISW